jgi:hypothetical protein
MYMPLLHCDKSANRAPHTDRKFAMRVGMRIRHAFLTLARDLPLALGAKATAGLTSGWTW